MAVRSLKEERIEKNIRDKNNEKVENIKTMNEERMENVLKKKPEIKSCLPSYTTNFLM